MLFYASIMHFHRFSWNSFLFLINIYLLHSSSQGKLFFPPSFMAPFWSIWATLVAMLACNRSLALASPSSQQQSVQVSTISAAPASDPLVSPTQSPETEPLFPTPVAGGVSHSPSYSSLPTIPSNRSPPNPDVLGTPGTVLNLLPSEAPAFQNTYQPLYSMSCFILPVIYIMWLHVLLIH
uniref:Uncharacterized protein n=2 Tax=Phaseolus vulgaris TaxID=3885 RepID=V7CY52_PHAVU|nr:hypothetical protein PHAVU_001G202300g [Phaseolus vulgaris]ESW35049.1 hypothetical protein PHAVU_001G202300g [Phaseolus vulgaris]